MKSLAEIDALVGELFDLEAKYEVARKEATFAAERCEAKRKEIMEELSSQGVTTFKGNVGTVTVATRYGVKFPKDPDVKAELKDFLTARGAFDGLWSVNHRSLNSWYKAELEAAQNQGTYLDVPGLEPIGESYLQFRKGGNK